MRISDWSSDVCSSDLRRFAATSDARKYLEGRLNTLRQNLETSERALINYTMNKGIVTISSQRDANGRTQTETLVGDDIDEASKGFAKARELRIASEAEVNNTLSGSAAIIAPPIDNLRERHGELQGEMDKLLVHLTIAYSTRTEDPTH